MNDRHNKFGTDYQNNSSNNHLNLPHVFKNLVSNVKETHGIQEHFENIYQASTTEHDFRFSFEILKIVYS